jgi:CheY-like chemotaxis protein
MNEHRASILVVDDDLDTCRNLADILSDLGYDVQTAPDGPTALELVKKQAFDVALLDFKMPGMNGLELYRAIRAVQPSAVALIVTAYAGPTPGIAAEMSPEEALAAGAWAVLPKPVDFPRLLALVEKATSQPLVMVVDDDHDLCATLWDLLREQGYRVGLAHDEKEARRCLAGQPYKVVLIDMKLPEGDGAGVFHLVRSTTPEARTVLITGHPAEMDPTIQRVVAEGADAVCYKPFDVPRLLDTLQRFTHRPEG